MQFAVATPNAAAAAVVSGALADPTADPIRLAAMQTAGLSITGATVDPDSLLTTSPAQAAALSISSAVSHGLSVVHTVVAVALVAATLC